MLNVKLDGAGVDVGAGVEDVIIGVVDEDVVGIGVVDELVVCAGVVVDDVVGMGVVEELGDGTGVVVGKGLLVV